MILLSLIRHGNAEDRDDFAQSGQPDVLRPLTPKGILQLKALRKEQKKLLKSVDQILCSPAMRTRQTAAELFAKNKNVLPSFFDWLAPGASAHSAVDGLSSAVKKKSKHLAIVGHEPQLSQLAQLLLVGVKNQNFKFKFFKGAIMVMEFQDLHSLVGGGTLMALISPI